ncbi:MAG: cobaltochelatase subunit CobN, partial [Anditalea sp.]
LMGAEPVWNSKGQVMDVRIIPDSLLRRPRIDVLVTTSGTYRDHFMDKIQLLDKAVKLVTIIQSPSNWVRNHALEYQEALGLKTVDQGTQRIFSTSPNTYSTNIEFAIEDGESWENDSTLSNLYIDRMANSYGQNANSEYQKELFTENIMDVEAAAFGRSSNVHGIMDHPMVASYFGAINLAVKNKTGKNPDLYINDVSDPGEAKTVKLEEFYQKELRSRYLNPNWIKNMQDQGYEGARYMQGFTENLLAWDITHTDMVTQADWDAVFDTYVNDKNKLGLNAYFEKHNPFAQKELIHTLQEANSKGYWAPSEKQQEIIADRLDKLNNSDRVPSLNNISNTEVSGYEMVNETRKIITNTAPNQPQQDTILWVLLIIAALIIMGWFSDDKIR